MKQDGEYTLYEEQDEELEYYLLTKEKQLEEKECRTLLKR